MKNFALLGAAGFVAPRHMRAIQASGNRLVAMLDPSDSVGVIDSFFPESAFFSEFERFDRHIDKLRRAGGSEKVDYVSICSPNYLHDSHIRFALRSEADAICEKPLVVNPWNVDGLAEAEASHGKKVNTILQLRVHPAIIALREKILAEPPGAPKHEVDLTYITGRGRWYLYSWKGEEGKSGGIVANIGVHFFDMLHFLFGDLQDSRVHLAESTRAGGYLEYERARVRWFLSLEVDDVPEAARESGQRTYRSITIDGDEIEFSGGFTDLHTRSYELILEGNGFGLDDARPAIDTVAGIRGARIAPGTSDRHPMAGRAR
ncbi:MAG TPA: Gfo/Idh/MocA family oxidoreductase [Sphingomicrobium sp.]|nr:Gfo/Idh/MocA family oxidoreductase [Sphingomicrobium sp.]